MKLTTLALLLLCANAIQAQNFAPVGATWYYQDFAWNEEIGFMKVEVIGDTIIDQKYTTILQNSVNYKVNESAYVFIHEENDRVFFYEENEFKLLYDFNLNAGDTLEFHLPKNAGQYYLHCGGVSPDGYDGLNKVVIDSVSALEIDGQLLKVQHTTAVCETDAYQLHNCWVFGRIIERIGTHQGFFGMYAIICLAGVSGHLRCYSDHEFESKLSVEECDHQNILSNVSLSPMLRLDLFPNPAFDRLRIESSSLIDELTIFDANGRTIKSMRMNTTTGVISIADLERGIYFVSIKSGRNVVYKKFIKSGS